MSDFVNSVPKQGDIAVDIACVLIWKDDPRPIEIRDTLQVYKH